MACDFPAEHVRKIIAAPIQFGWKIAMKSFSARNKVGSSMLENDRTTGLEVIQARSAMEYSRWLDQLTCSRSNENTRRGIPRVSMKILLKNLLFS
jgi:hypothetical protein